MKGDSRAELYKPHLKGKLLALSFATVGELQFWAHKRNWSARRVANLNLRIRSAVIIPFDFALCETYGRVKAILQAAGKTTADNDLWIASSAIRHSMPLVSHNREHFVGIPNLQLISCMAP